MKIAFVSGPFESLGLEYLSAVLKADGHQTKLFMEPCILRDDGVFLQNDRLHNIFDCSDYLVNELIKYQPAVIGMSVVTDYYQLFLTIARKIKKELNVPIVLGGVHPSAVPEEVLKEDVVDYICVGEGEHAFLDLVSRMKQETRTDNIDNIWLADGRGIIKNKLRNLVDDLDALPFPDKDLYYRESNFFRYTYSCMTSRGCFYNCPYCFNNYWKKLYSNKGGYFRRRSIDNVIEELSQGMQGKKYTNVRFCDDIFNHEKDWLNKFFDLYTKEIKKSFDCQLWLKAVDTDLAKILKNAGCYLVELGVQSFSEGVRTAVLDRRYSNRDIETAIDSLKSQGIRVSCDNIYGIPGENHIHIKAALKFYLKKDVSAAFYGLRFYPKTKMIDIAKEEQLLNDEDVNAINSGKGASLFTFGGDSLNSGFLKIHRVLFLNNFLPSKLILKKIDFLFNLPTPSMIIIQLQKVFFLLKSRPLKIAGERVKIRLHLYVQYSFLKLKHIISKKIEKYRIRN
ncbi:MAG: B12-binding domain-containing radical SAM protein [PVC group bacterium]|nr:B12-binding domain-containing radical SAM protein [PVC group bacterium]